MVSETRPYDNSATQAEKRQILKDTYLNRAAADADLTSQGRFKRETATRVTGVPVYSSLPESSPWSNGFDTNVEPVLGFSVDEMPAVGTPNETQSTLAPNLATEVASPSGAGDRANEGPIIGSTVAPFPATDEPVIGSSMKRRRTL